MYKFPENKPKLNEIVLIFMEQYNSSSEYFCTEEVAAYVVNPYDKRRRCFIPRVQFEVNTLQPWIYKYVTRWMYLPKLPKRISIEEFLEMKKQSLKGK